jgi:hypothetical protein
MEASIGLRFQHQDRGQTASQQGSGSGWHESQSGPDPKQVQFLSETELIDSQDHEKLVPMVMDLTKSLKEAVVMARATETPQE